VDVVVILLKILKDIINQKIRLIINF